MYVLSRKLTSLEMDTDGNPLKYLNAAQKRSIEVETGQLLLQHYQ